MVTAERVALDEELERAFDRKRTNFLEDYDLKAKPALIWQARPSNPLKVDISSEKLREAMRGGGGPTTDDGWWRGFKMSWHPSLVFDGLASTMDSGSAGWVSEIHIDGHLLAGLWTFPESAPGSTNPVAGIADFYVNAFRDFTYLAGKVFEAAGASGVVHLTATMHQADKLALVANPGRVVVSAPKRRTLRWPISAVSPTELPRAGSEMAAQFMRVYGRKASNP
jgi:hypothetical protein